MDIGLSKKADKLDHNIATNSKKIYKLPIEEEVAQGMLKTIELTTLAWE